MELAGEPAEGREADSSLELDPGVEEPPGGAALDADSSFEVDVEAEKEKAKSRWDEVDEPAVVVPPEEEEPEPLSSPRSCPPTPEAVPPGLRTPPPSTSAAGRARAGRRSRSLDCGARPGSPEEATCPICLGAVENKSMTDSCLHKFCFTCLQEWSKVGSCHSAPA
jgi:hypothetical protein